MMLMIIEINDNYDNTYRMLVLRLPMIIFIEYWYWLVLNIYK